MKIKKFISIMENIFPLSLQEDYDNSGGQVIFNNLEVSSVLLSLDADRNIIDEALFSGCNLIVTHHPLLFQPLKNIISSDPQSDLIMKLIENKISLYSLHTNLDKIYSDRLGGLLGFRKNALLLPKGSFQNGDPAGFGSISILDKAIELHELLRRIKEKLKLQFIIYTGSPDTLISRVAILNGSGGKSVEHIIQKNDIDCIITGDIGYHHAKAACDYGIPVIDAGHYGTEKILIEFLKKDLMDCLTKYNRGDDIKIIISKIEKNPFILSI